MNEAIDTSLAASNDPNVAQTRTKQPFRVSHPLVLARTAPFLAAGVLRGSDLAILDAAAGRFALADDPEITLALAFALAAPRQGNVGVELTKLADRWLPSAQNSAATGVGKDDERAVADALRDAELLKALPDDLAAWQDRVAAHSTVGTWPFGTDAPAELRQPFVLQPMPPRAVEGREDPEKQGILMTNRHWREQFRLAQALAKLAAPVVGYAPPQLQSRLDRVYPRPSAASLGTTSENDQPRAAAEMVAKHRLSVITGGPGTGKTWGIKRVLAILIEAAADAGQTLTIELAAPTGKASGRMREAMASEANIPGVRDDTLTALQALAPRTLHNLLGVLPHKPQAFRHGLSQRLGADIVVVDEASMVDLSLMRHLVEAISDDSRLILLGDRDQLASVDAGTVLADIVNGAFDGRQARSCPLDDRIARLTVSHRFKEAASIACVADALQSRKSARIAASVALMCGEKPEDPAILQDWTAKMTDDPSDSLDTLRRIRWLDRQDMEATTVLAQLAGPYIDDSVDNLRHEAAKAPARGRELLPAAPGYAALLCSIRDDSKRRLTTADEHKNVLDALERYRVLTPHRSGARGVAGLNQRLTEAVQDKLTTGHKKGRKGIEKSGRYWLGQPLMITRNTREVDLKNGDIGLVLPRNVNGRRELWAAFADSRAKTESNPGVRYVALGRLPANETALAMTVHKSQGSQFERIALVLPEHADSPILTRELIYTGITRAKWRVDWTGGRTVLASALGRGLSRASGLSELLWR